MRLDPEPLSGTPRSSAARGILDLQALKLLDAVYAKRRETVKTINKFWPTVFDEHSELEPFLQYRDDLQALSHLTDFWLERDPKEPRAFTAEFVSGPRTTLEQIWHDC